MNNNANKDTKNKFTTDTDGLFDESSLDEMQKAENYRIGFKLFRACYWFMYFFSMYIFIAAVNMENTIFTVCGIISMTAASVFHIIYSAKVSAKGVMNPKYADKMGKPAALFMYTIVLIMGAFSVAYTGKPVALLLLAGPGVMVLCDCFFARRNNRVLEKILKEDSENEE